MVPRRRYRCGGLGGGYVAAFEKLKKAIAVLPQHQIPDHQVQEIRGMLEDETREKERAEQEYQEMREVRVSTWNLITDLLSRASTSVDIQLKRPKQ